MWWRLTLAVAACLAWMLLSPWWVNVTAAYWRRRGVSIGTGRKANLAYIIAFETAGTLGIACAIYLGVTQ